MTPQEFSTLYEYDAWANARTLKACAALTPEQFTRNLGNSFGSVRDTLVHILGAQMVWIVRLTGGAPAGMPSPEGYPDLASVRAKWGETEPTLQAYVSALKPEDVGRTLEYRNLKGILFRDQIGNILQHLANHGSYHRGQVTTLLRQLGAAPVSTDLIGFYRERAAANAAANVAS
jgi:uncharacterized damage-inducible protein DinB